MNLEDFKNTIEPYLKRYIKKGLDVRVEIIKKDSDDLCRISILHNNYIVSSINYGFIKYPVTKPEVYAKISHYFDVYYKFYRITEKLQKQFKIVRQKNNELFIIGPLIMLKSNFLNKNIWVAINVNQDYPHWIHIHKKLCTAWRLKDFLIVLRDENKKNIHKDIYQDFLFESASTITGSVTLQQKQLIDNFVIESSKAKKLIYTKHYCGEIENQFKFRNLNEITIDEIIEIL